ncbi:MAG: Smr/MutS family protein [Allosphingosinicella sp.]|uniref:Smr/MutS family protein n=1 Tax=Allosphingosinicella sp. TaxID=2823234 RepID=UPI00394C12B8
MDRPLSAEERALWAKVIRTVRPLHQTQAADAAPEEPAPPPAPAPKAARAAPRPTAAAPARAVPGTTLDGGWDRRLSRGLVAPDMTIDLHGHSLQGAYGRLDDSLERAVAGGARLLLLITGKPPTDDRRPVARGAIRAAVGHWLAASRHAADIAAVRGAHPRHGGTGALYIVLRRRR